MIEKQGDTSGDLSLLRLAVAGSFLPKLVPLNSSSRCHLENLENIQ